MELRSFEQQSPARLARRKHFVNSVFAAALVCSAVAASAQTIYRQVDTEGRTIFTDRPAATAVTLASYSAASSVQRDQAGLAGGSARAEAAPGVRAVDGAGERAGNRTPPFGAETIDRREAYRRLQQAQREFARGLEAQPGPAPLFEGMPGERSRERLEKLRRNVEAAQARMREVSTQGYTAGYTAGAASPAVPLPMVLASSSSASRTR